MAREDLQLRTNAAAFVRDPRDVPDGVYIDNPHGDIIPNGSFGRIRVYYEGALVDMYARTLTGQWRDCMARAFVAEGDLPHFVRNALTKACS